MARRAMKQTLAWLLQLAPPATWALRLGVRLRAPRHRVGVLALVRRDDGRILIARHVFRPWNPWGLLGGWLETGEDPQDAIRRELREELGSGVRIAVLRLLVAGQHAARGEPDGLSLIYECRIEGTPAEALPLELLSLHWLSEEKARRILRPLEVRALDSLLHLSQARLDLASAQLQ